MYIIPFCFATPQILYSYYKDTTEPYNISGARQQNYCFEEYFGTEVTSTELKNLLSEIRTNNPATLRNIEAAIVGICYISEDYNGEQVAGVYKLKIDPTSHLLYG